MPKTAKTFRLSGQAIEHLRSLVDLTGSSETAIVELSLAHLARLMRLGQRGKAGNAASVLSKSATRRRRRRRGKGG